MKPTFRFRPGLESLDRRSLLSVTLANGLLDVFGSTGPDVIRITQPAAGKIRATCDSTGDNQTFDLSAVRNILVRSRGGDDTVVVGPNITVPAEVRAWAGDDTVLGGGGNDTI